MCGIMGYVGGKRAAPVLCEGLKVLEYRGYDSAGICVLREGKFLIEKREGRIAGLEKRAGEMTGNIGIGHTRWATHGEPTTKNAHPHIYKNFAIVHNGIIENYATLMQECTARGEKFFSSTDSEVIAHLLAYYFQGDLLEAVRRTVKRLEGSFAVAALCLDAPETIAAFREKSPLSVGVGEGECYLASDLPALANKNLKVYPLENGDTALLTKEGVKFFREEGEVEREELKTKILPHDLTLNGYSHYMWKEIWEIPAAIEKTLQNFEANPRFSQLCEVLCQTEYIEIVACGTAYHSGLAAKCAFERLARVKTSVTVASEFRYMDPVVLEHTLVIAVSQSGETADTIAAANLAKRLGAKVVAVTNVMSSSITSVADFVLFTCAGTEIGVAATKSFNAQLALLFSLAVKLSVLKKGGEDLSLNAFPSYAREVLCRIEEVKEFAKEIYNMQNLLFIGRETDYPVSLEGSLKIKEISYLSSEGYPAGELKHGTLALVNRDTPVVCIQTVRALAEKTMNALSEVSARGGRVYLFTCFPEFTNRSEVYKSFLLPALKESEELFSPLISVIPLQALAYFTALFRGCDPDKPRNLAKSVTVE